MEVNIISVIMVKEFLKITILPDHCNDDSKDVSHVDRLVKEQKPENQNENSLEMAQNLKKNSSLA